MVDNIDSNSLKPPLKSGFRKSHSTESLVTRAFNCGQVTLLAFYDVKVAGKRDV